MVLDPFNITSCQGFEIKPREERDEDDDSEDADGDHSSMRLVVAALAVEVKGVFFAGVRE